MRLNFSDIRLSGNEFRPFSSEYLSYGVISVDGFDARNKFAPIFLKEVAYGVEVGGKIELNLSRNNQVDINLAVKLIDVYLPNFSILNTLDPINNKSMQCLIAQKMSAELESDDSMDSWSFGIISNGKRPEFILRLIDSILEQNIKNTELILCGYIEKETEDEIRKRKINFTYFEMNEFDSLGWITRKKNIVMENAKFQNVMILHDRFVLHNLWHKKMQSYGNTFEVLACRNENIHGNRITDWVTIGNVFSKMKNFAADYDLPRPYLLDCRDWTMSSMIAGGATIIKRKVWLLAKWDERRFWIEEEDTLLSNMQQLMGVVPRYFSGAIVISLVSKGENIRPLKYSPNKSGVGITNAFRDCVSYIIKNNKTLRKAIYKDI